jgi:hypothetical protein
MAKKGYTKSGRKLPEIVCCRCGAFLGYGAWNQMHDLDKEPCDDCHSVVTRKRIADKIKKQRHKKRHLSKLGKRAVELQESQDYDHAPEGSAFTPMRYVSHAEIEEMRRRIRSCTFGADLAGWEMCGCYITVFEIRPERFSNRTWRIYRPGFYRVEEMPDDMHGYVKRWYYNSLGYNIDLNPFRNYDWDNNLDRRKEQKGLAEYREIGEKRKKLEQKRIEQLPDPRFVYLISVCFESKSYYKIGISKDPETRRKAIATHIPVIPLLVRSFWSQNAKREEDEMHFMFRDCHSHGEWFLFDDAKLNEVLSEYERRCEVNQQREAAA